MLPPYITLCILGPCTSFPGRKRQECPCTSFFTQDTIPKILPYSCCFFSQQPPVICLPSSKASASQPEKKSFAWGE